MSELQQVFAKPQKIEDINAEKPLIDIDLSMCIPGLKPRMIRLINTIAQYSPIGKELLEQAQKDGYKMMMIGASGWSGQVMKDEKMLMLNSVESDNYLVEVMSHECRHIQQFARNVPFTTEEYTIKDGIRLHRAKEADCEATGAAVAHQVSVNAGLPEVWESFKAERKEIAQGFENACKDKTNPEVSHEMLQGAFNGWYKEPQLQELYETGYVLNGLCNSVYNEKVPFDKVFQKKTTSAQIVKTVCADNKGGCYWEENLNVLNEPEKCLINDSSMYRINQVLCGMEKLGGKPQDYSHMDMPRREEYLAKKEQEKSKNDEKIMQKAIRQKLSMRNR
ncbi:MAG: hypothetical protein MJ247_03870 [Alphaproteobacteria bacterium]|nr:hypothetical protein [Alphaproteobacteria bacterium]